MLLALAVTAVLAAWPTPIEAPATVRVGQSVNITLSGGPVARRTFRGEDLIVVLQPTAQRGQDGIGASPRSPFPIAAAGEVVHITFKWPAFDNACTATGCRKIRWRTNRRVDINVCAKSRSRKLEVCERATATLRP